YIVDAANRNLVISGPTVVPPGKSITVTIPKKAVFQVYCTIHGGMTARLTTTGSFELTEEQKKAAAKAAATAVPPMAKAGEKLFWGKAQCHQCHMIGDRGDGLRGPNLQDIGFRAPLRAKKLGLASGTEYLVQSLMEPQAYIVEGYTKAMEKVYQPPVNLGEEEIKALIAYLQSQGGKVDTWAIDIDRTKLASLPAMNPFRYGDAARGKKVFEDAGCGSCHAIGEQRAGTVGPELTDIGAYRDWTWLAESVIDPNAEVGKNWQNATVYLKSGKSTSGILREDTPEQVKIMVSSDQFKTFPRADVERVEISEKSRMPESYGEILTYQQMADLITYLQSLKAVGR
ncbi:MAG: c-type cytochrome, partial [Candidatus Binatia bacterium]